MTELGRRFRTLSAIEARRALYIDFEGRKNEAPVLLGTLRRAGRTATPSVQHDVLDQSFSSFGHGVQPLHDVVRNVVMRAERHDRRIVSWSQYDLEVVRTLRAVDADLVDRFESRYANGLAVARRWQNALHRSSKPSSGTLTEYLALVAYRPPEAAAGGAVGRTVAVLRKRLTAGRPLRSGDRERWERLLEHNRHDCKGMRAVCVQAAGELEAAAAREPAR